MAANEELRRVLHNFFSYAAVIIAWIAAYVCHEHIGTLAGEAQVGLEDASQFASVGIAIYSPHGAQLL